MDTLLKDVRYALRALHRRPAFTAAIVATFALGIGASTAMFSIVNAALLRPLPFAEPEGLVMLQGVAGPERDVRGASVPEIGDWRARNRTLTDVAIVDAVTLALRTDAEPQRLSGEMVSAGYFPLLGARAARGRTFLPEEDRTPDSHAVVVLGHALWTTRFGGDPAVVGRTITLNDRAFTVVGVMPEGFRGLSFEADFWVPSMMLRTANPGSSFESRGSRWLMAVARLRPATALPDAQRDLDAVAAQLAVEHPRTNADRGVQLVPLRDSYLGDTRNLLLAMLAAVGLFLFIACANVASLQLVRGMARRREMALRVAVGASRGRLVRQMLTETMVLALLGGAAGLLAAVWGVDALVALVPEGTLPAYLQVGPDVRVLGVSLLLSFGCGVLVGLAPALGGSSLRLTETLKDGARSASGGLGSLRRPGVQQLLVIGELAVALVLLVGGGLMVRSLREQLAVELGFQADGVLAASVTLPDGRYDPDATRRFVAQLGERLRAIPGVQGVGVASDVPLRGGYSASVLRTEERPEDDVRYYLHMVSPGVFDALGMRVLRGRGITAEDRADAPAVAVVSEAMARRFWPGGDAVGRRFHFGQGPDAELVTIVGVVAQVRHRDLTTDIATGTSEPDVYYAFAQLPTRDLQLVLRTAGAPATLVPRLRQEIAALDAGLPVYDVGTLADAVRQQTATGRFASLVLSTFGGFALVLAAVGVYGLLAFVVGLSAREIAIRMAIGATGRDVVGFVVRQGLGLVAAGLTLGLVGAWLATRALERQLYGVTPTDPATFALVSLVLLGVALLAIYLPARRASRIEPLTALKGE